MPIDFFLEQLPAHLYGISYFGDNIQDEWFIVSLLVHLSREVDGLIVRTCDSDGEFLLIEAADHLPQWANPETCEQRVSINRTASLVAFASAGTQLRELEREANCLC